MKFKKLNSSKLISVNLSQYAINWDEKSCSKIQTEVKNYLRPYWSSQICGEEFRIPGCKLRVDLINFTRRIAVEVSPKATHNNFSPFFHGTRAKYLAAIKREESKRVWLKKNNFVLVEVFDEDIPLSCKFFQEKYNISI